VKQSTEEELIAQLYARLPVFHLAGSSAYKPGLERIQELTDALGKPQLQYKTIQVAGTNGKGSVSHLLASVLQQAGQRTGLYTSPHLVSFRERIKVNGENIKLEDFRALNEELSAMIPSFEPSFYEYLTALALKHFANKQCGWAVIETGLGGRLDASTIVDPEIAIVTNIGLDHTDLLGETRELIAFEKAGIFKPDTPALVGVRDDETEAVFLDQATSIGTSLHFAEEIIHLHNVTESEQGWRVDVDKYGEPWLSGLQTDLRGVYQLENLRTVLAALTLLQPKYPYLTDEAIRAGLKHGLRDSGLRGRLDWLRPIGERAGVLADVAHNPAGMQALLHYLATLPSTKTHFVLGFSGDKDHQTLLNLLPRDATYYLVGANSPRALPVSTLGELTKSKGIVATSYPSVAKGLHAALETANAGELIVITGSLYVVGEALAAWADEKA
jgi:dihydrofolate synthase / folylpolyglutamate synthase